MTDEYILLFIQRIVIPHEEKEREKKRKKKKKINLICQPNKTIWATMMSSIW